MLPAQRERRALNKENPTPLPPTKQLPRTPPKQRPQLVHTPPKQEQPTPPSAPESAEHHHPSQAHQGWHRQQQRQRGRTGQQAHAEEGPSQSAAIQAEACPRRVRKAHRSHQGG